MPATAFQSALIVTDVRFWNGNTGAEQRILALASKLPCDQVSIIFNGEVDSEERSVIESLSFNIQPVFPVKAPSGAIASWMWSLECFWHAVKKVLRRAARSKDPIQSDTPQTTQTFDRQLRFAKSRVIEFIKENRVDWVLIEYLTFAPIAFEIRKKIRPETQPVIAVDTHDLLHRRASDFRQHGFEHWIEINEAEEIAALKPFDQIVAIQEEEARFFTKHCDSHQSVIIATHPIKSLEHQPLESQTAEWDSALSNKIGYFASANRSNESAIVDFLTKVWPQVDSKFELIIAGNICQSERVNGALKDLEESISRRVKLIGRVATIQAFYDQVGIVINPVTFGTGLKIKNVEAIAMGKCLITTPAGQAGLTCDFVSQSWDVDKACYIAVSNDDEFSEALNRLAKETKIVQEISANALKFSQENLTAERVYRDLWRNIKERLSESRTD